MVSIAVESALGPLMGRICDVDSHEMVNTSHWETEFGVVAAPFAALLDSLPSAGVFGNFTIKIEDEAKIDPANIWKVKGSPAPSAIDIRRRPEVLDVMGIDRQLIFSTGPGVFGLVFCTCPPERFMKKILGPEVVALAQQMNLSQGEAVSIGRQFLAGFNDWCIRAAAVDPRMRPVALLDTTSIDGALGEAQRVVDAGVRAVQICSDCPPGGLSPASTELDAFWQFFEDTNVPVILHVGGELNFMQSLAWGEVPLFAPNVTDTAEIAVDPYTLSTMHFGAQNFLTTMILGGVFERHPDLRFGVIELTSHWVGPMAENLGMWIDQFAKRYARVLQLTPSEYLERNVRVTSFWWEPVDKYIDCYGLEHVYAFGSDFPHFEGGEDSAELFAQRLKRLGPDALERFFVSNGELLLPD